MKLIKKALFLGLFSAITTLSFAQGDIWQQLSNITYKKEYNEIMGFKVDVPVFAENIKSMEGKEIEIKGYIIPIEGYKSHKEFVFSAYPYSMCFFCGGAGPETVMEVFATEPVKYTDDPITLRGKLELNSQDINRLIYAIHEATIVKE
ncbi:MAG: hypothetical protein KJP00_05285 [Bacteroidia bacterium]|nr:hypothetical protein [Bacteroidia bacterium]